jgi:hypothetical protein
MKHASILTAVRLGVSLYGRQNNKVKLMRASCRISRNVDLKSIASRMFNYRRTVTVLMLPVFGVRDSRCSGEIGRKSNPENTKTDSRVIEEGK